MTVTFLLTISTTDTDLVAVASEIAEDLKTEYDVVSCKPWARATLTSASPLVAGAPNSPNQNGQ